MDSMGPPLPQLGLGQTAAAHPRPLRVSCRACAAHARASPPPCRRQARGPRAGAGRPCPALQPRGRGAASRSSRGSRRPTPPSTTLEAPRTRLLSRATALLRASRGLCRARPGVAGRLPGGSASGSGLVCLVLFCVFILWSLMDTDPSIISPWKIKNFLGSRSPFILQVTLQLHDTRGVPRGGGTGVSGQGGRHHCVPHLSLPLSMWPDQRASGPSACAWESCQDRRAAPAPTEGGVLRPLGCSGLGGQRPPSGWPLHAQQALRSAAGSWSLPLDVATAW